MTNTNTLREAKVEEVALDLAKELYPNNANFSVDIKCLYDQFPKPGFRWSMRLEGGFDPDALKKIDDLARKHDVAYTIGNGGLNIMLHKPYMEIVT